MNYPTAAELGRILLINVGADSRQRFKNRHPEMAPTKSVETGLSPASNSLTLKKFYSQSKGCGYIMTQSLKKGSRC